MPDIKVTIPLHQAKDIGFLLNNTRGLIHKCYINPIFKKVILSYMNEAISKLQESVKISEKKGANV